MIAQTASQSFGHLSVWQLLAAPLFGARVAIVPNAIAHDLAGPLWHVGEQGITVLESVPSLIQACLPKSARPSTACAGCCPPARRCRRNWRAPVAQARYLRIGQVNAYGAGGMLRRRGVLPRRPGLHRGAPTRRIGSPTDNNAR
ncbi:hypothetical protein ACPA9J_19035 [Pseudomonas aeruginosa]